MHSWMERIRKWAQSLTQRQKLIILRVVMAEAAALIVFGAARMFWLQKQYADADREYAKVRELAGVTDPSGDNDLESVGTVSSSSSGSAAALLPGELPTVALDKLQKENPDTVGWLYAPALGINYPIMQDTDNTYAAVFSWTRRQRRTFPIRIPTSSGITCGTAPCSGV